MIDGLLYAFSILISPSQWLPPFQLLAVELPIALAALVVPLVIMYGAILALLKRYHRTHVGLTLLSTTIFLSLPYVSPVHCGPYRSLQRFAIATACMKLWDIFIRRKDLPKYVASPEPPSDYALAALYLSELRYESFTPNPMRMSKAAEDFSEPNQLAVHIGAFAVLQALPQEYPTVLAFEVLLAIYIIWTTMQLTVRNESSPALFGPLYLADSLGGFWSETWHNGFTASSHSIGYRPFRKLANYGVPVAIARGLGVIGVFAVMALFHIYALEAILPWHSLKRIALFFLINGAATVIETAIWGRKPHWIRKGIAWGFETWLATWTAQECHIPLGLWNVRWREFCDRASQSTW